MEEIWKDIKGYEGLYQISEHSEIKSLIDNFGRKQERILKSSIGGNGYLKICLYKDGNKNFKLVHRLLAEAFIPNPNNLPVILHLDNNKLNLDLSNLKWGTQKENNYQIINEGRNNFTNGNHPDKGKKRGNNKHSKKVNQYSVEGIFIKTFDCLKDGAEEIGITYNNICRACKKGGNAGGYKWKYNI